eukprot:Ihof_evm10s114 gene=Ihof_evmTU10s114
MKEQKKQHIQLSSESSDKNTLRRPYQESELSTSQESSRVEEEQHSEEDDHISVDNGAGSTNN